MKKVIALLFVVQILNSHSHAQKNEIQIPVKPKLVVGIVVDQMKMDYIFRYWNKFGEGGFKRLVNGGYFCKNAQYNYIPTYTGPGHASIYTGTTPASHGIIGNNWYQAKSRDTMYCVKDTAVNTLGAVNKSGKMSPKNLLATTVCDELRLATNFKAKVFGISMKDRGAILPAGKSANAAYWYDVLTGNWISSTYYMNDLPSWVQEFNAKKYSEKYINTPWTTLLPIESYTESTADDTPYEGKFAGELKPIFPHDFPKIKTSDFELVRKSPWGNMLTTDFTIAAIESEKLGADEVTDFLAVSYSSTDYVGHQFGTNAIETEDTYLRLDKDFERLLNTLDSKIGMQDVLIFITADHAAIANPQYLLDHKITSGWFNTKAVNDTLKKWLHRQYGDSSLLLYFDDNQVYFNRDLCERKKIPVMQLQNECAEILFLFEGVKDVVTAHQLQRTEFTFGIKHLLQMGFMRKRSGDVFMLLDPGIIDWSSKTGTTHGSPYTYDTHVPLIWYGASIPKGSNYNPINITDIAATLSHLLQTEYPNACNGKPIVELLGK